MILKRLAALVFATILFCGPAFAQETSTKPTADPKDVESVDAIMAAVYEVISGPAGYKRDWDRFRSLFIDGARLIPTAIGEDGKGGNRVWTVDEYITSAGSYLEENGFFEVEIGRVTESYGRILHCMSAYESRRNADDPEPFVRGVNSFQLWNDGARWWVVTIYWQGETENFPIPAKFIGAKN